MFAKCTYGSFLGERKSFHKDFSKGILMFYYFPAHPTQREESCILGVGNNTVVNL